MTFHASAPSRIVIKTSRETLVLCGAATAMTFALSYVVHSKPEPARAVAPMARDWTGHLANVTSAPVAASSNERVTSASLVLPKEQLALPKLDLRPLAKLRFCEGGMCGGKGDVPVPQPRRDTVERTAERVALKHDLAEPKPGLLSRLNPLKQVAEVPGMLKKPFVYAGDTVSGWFKRF